MIRYLNTDLDLMASSELAPLVAAFEARNALTLVADRLENGLWVASFETSETNEEPGPDILALLTVVESMAETELCLWRACSVRQFNIGYDCGYEPWGFNQGLPTDLLGRIVAVNASLRITLYPTARPSEKPPH